MGAKIKAGIAVLLVLIVIGLFLMGTIEWVSYVTGVSTTGIILWDEINTRKWLREQEEQDNLKRIARLERALWSDREEDEPNIRKRIARLEPVVDLDRPLLDKLEDLLGKYEEEKRKAK